MDASLAVGICLSLVGLVTTVLFGTISWMDFFHPLAAIWVVLGTSGVSFLSGRRTEVQDAWARGWAALRGHSGSASGLSQLAGEISLVAQAARKEGLLQIDPEKLGIKHVVLKESTKRIAEGLEIQQVDEVLKYDQDRQARNREKAAEAWEVLAAQSPMVGIIGAVFGLFPLFKVLDQPEKIGAVMIFPFASTLYGLAFSAFLAAPIAARLRESTISGGKELEILRTGLRGIGEGVAPAILEQKLRAMI